MLSSLLALSLAAGPSTLLVWGGGKTPEEAQKSLAEWKAKSPQWLTYVQLAAASHASSRARRWRASTPV
ncbi:MAG: hypothetical protein ABTQ32_03205, partial [Myxococcaceae bacterium]